MNILGTVAVAAIGALGAFGLSKHVSKQLAETRSSLQSELDKTRQTISEVTTTAVTALPGGMWNIKLADLWGKDPKKQEEAREFFRKIIGGELPKPHQHWEVFVTSKGDLPLRGRLYLLPNADPEYVKQHVVSSSRFENLTTRAYRPLTDAEVNSRIDQELKKFTEIAFGVDATGAWLDPDNRSNAALWWIGSAAMPQQAAPGYNGPNGRSAGPTWTPSETQKFTEAARVGRANAAAALREAMVAAFQRTFKAEGPATTVFDWHPMSGSRLLVAVLDAQDWQAHGEAVEIVAVLTADDSAGMSSTAPTAKTEKRELLRHTFRLENFKKQHHRFQDPNLPERELIFGEMNLSDQMPITLDGVKALEQLKEINHSLAEFRKKD
ncbi:MAG TPA: hypothetical protein VM940_00275 [Chthoniobacterales bacterium]|jgi:hypothetical protein|nr:hypothetical protein [Chthoniobacterales bacterium]